MPIAKSLAAVVVAGLALAGCRREYRVDPIAPPEPEPPPAEPPPMPGFALPDAGARPDAPTGPSAPGNAQCAEVAFRARYAPVDLMLLVDSSLSMASPVAGNTTKWALTYEALLAFVRDPRSAGFGVGLQFFPTFPPVDTCTMESDCTPTPGGLQLGSLCVKRNVCIGGDGRIVGTLACDGLGLLGCPQGASCVPAGRCAMTQELCTGIGQPCFADQPGNLCAELPRRCRQLDMSASCYQPVYATPRVPIGELPGAEPALQRALEEASPEGKTPMGPAVDGVLESLRAHLRTRPERRAILVLASDGLPEGCMPNLPIYYVASALHRAYTTAPSIATYVIGVFDQATAAEVRDGLGQLAMAGGTEAPFVLDPDLDLRARLLEALGEIRGKALGCEFEIPKPAAGAVDFMKINVRVGGSGGSRDLLYVAGAERCDPARGGWHYDVSPASGTPTRILTCPATCQALQQDRNPSVELRVGCQTRVD